MDLPKYHYWEDAMILKKTFSVTQKDGDTVIWTVDNMTVNVDFEDMSKEDIAERFAMPTVVIAAQGQWRKGTKDNCVLHDNGTIKAKDFKTGQRVKVSMSEKALKLGKDMVKAGKKQDLADTIQQMILLAKAQGIEIPGMKEEE
jgi:hypothetical protein